VSETAEFIALVEQHTGRPGKQHGRNIRLLCPGHDDHNPSLDVAEGDDGRPLTICRSHGCTFEAICEVISWEPPDRDDGDGWTPRGPLLKAYRYTDEQRKLLFEVCRTESKEFPVRRPDPSTKSGWRWSVRGVRRVLYRLPEVLAAVADGYEVYVPEGEKDADALAAAGVTATCNPFGAGQWDDAYSEVLRGANVVIVQDRDDLGREHAAKVVASLAGIAASVRVVEAAEGKDAADHLAAGLTVHDLVPGTLWSGSDVRPLCELLDDLVAFTRRFVFYHRPQAAAIALWIAHTHAVEAAFDTTPYLVLTSAEKRSGKSRLLEILELLVHSPLLAVNMSDAALFRVIEKRKPTLLLDEADAIFGSKGREREELRGMLNAGWRRGAKSYRMGGANNRVLEEFAVFCPKAFAGIGDYLPGTLDDRAIILRLERRTRDERVERFRRREVVPEAEGLRAQLVATIEPRVNELSAARPLLPDELDDRAQDCWEPLLALADLAGGEWPGRARAAALKLSSGEAREDDSLSIRLLTDIETVFTSTGTQALKTSTLIEELGAIEESPWGDWYGKPISAQKLSQLLHPYRIKTMSIWVEGAKARGYKREQFTETWNRYLAPAQRGPTVPGGRDGSDGRRKYPSQAAPTTPTTPTTSDGEHPFSRSTEWRCAQHPDARTWQARDLSWHCASCEPPLFAAEVMAEGPPLP
jgi:hypothetical protein